MRKYLVGFFILVSLIVGFSVSAALPAPKVEINGVKVYSPYNHVKKDVVYVDTEAFFQVLNQEYQIDNASKTISFGEESVPFKSYKEGIVASLEDLADLVSSAGYTTQLTKNEEGSAYLLVLPEGVIKLTPSVPKMGEHWARVADMPVGPIYGVEKGKLIFIEQMPAQQFFIEGKSLVGLDGMRGLPSPAIDHTNIEFQDDGHEGFLVDHYDIHHYFITPEERDAIEGDSLPH